MNLTLHLTEDCNMACSYCIRQKRPARMSVEVLHKACELAFSVGNRAGLCFFGGEPLLERELIFEALAYCARLSAETGKPVQYKMTTNGTLLDAEFLARARAVNMGIGLSYDGTAQDICRRFADGSGSAGVLSAKATLLLKYLPESYAMMTVAPQAADRLAESVRLLRGMGFRRISAVPAYGRRVRWDDASLAVLRAQLREVASFYEEEFLRGEPFFFSPFDGKIRDCISGYNPSERCHLGMRQMPVAPDGKIYACTQFIGDAAYELGDVFHGLDRERQRALASRSGLPESCKECALRQRCTNACGCMNRMETGNENKVSAMQCSYERMLIEISDEVAERMFTADRDAFIKKFTA